MKEIICLKRGEDLKSFYPVNCMRPSTLGNPFPMKNESEREACIEKFRQYLWKELKGNGKVRMFMNTLAYSDLDIALICCCKPKKCHTDIIKGALLWMRETNYK